MDHVRHLPDTLALYLEELTTVCWRSFLVPVPFFPLRRSYGYDRLCACTLRPCFRTAQGSHTYWRAEPKNPHCHCAHCVRARAGAHLYPCHTGVSKAIEPMVHWLNGDARAATRAVSKAIESVAHRVDGALHNSIETSTAIERRKRKQRHRALSFPVCSYSWLEKEKFNEYALKVVCMGVVTYLLKYLCDFTLRSVTASIVVSKLFTSNSSFSMASASSFAASIPQPRRTP